MVSESEQSAPVTYGRLFAVWLTIGAQSFGGGSATLSLIRRAVVDGYHWVSEDEFTRYWTLCQLAPGINLLGLTVLVGRRIAGLPGVALALLGLLLPSCAITVLITACYAHFEGAPAVRAALRGVIPATVGVGMLTCYQLAAPLIVASRREGGASLWVSIIAIAGSAVVTALWHAPVVMVLCAAGIVGAVYHTVRERGAA
jgi:chromate transporter